MPIYDFDEAVKEEEKEPVSVKVMGRVYELAPQLPARVVLKQIKLMDESGGIGTADLPEWLGSLVGEDNLKQMLEDGASWQQLENVTMKLLIHYKVMTEEQVPTGDDSDPK